MKRTLQQALTVILVSLVLVFSGCVGGKAPFGGGGGKGGVRINSFSVYPSTVYDRDEFDIELELENLGVADTDVNVYIWGPAWLNSGNVIEKRVNLSGADPINNIPGGREIITGTYTADVGLPPRTKQTYPINARICYPYESVYITTITVVSKNEFRVSRSGFKQNQEELARAPIIIDLASLPEYTKNKLVVNFVISNNGYGHSTSAPCSATIEYNKVNRISSFSLEAKGVSGTIECTPQNDIYLSNGRAMVRCEIPVGGETISTPNLQITLIAKATYNYFVDASTSITVIAE